MTPQPAPIINQLAAVWPLVIEQMQARHDNGIRQYGIPLQPFNSRDALTDLLDELLDAAVYCKQLQLEDNWLANPKVRTIISNIINTPAVSIDWGHEYCPLCEKPYLNDTGAKELDELEERYGVESSQFQTALARFCDETYHAEVDLFEELCRVKRECAGYKNALQQVLVAEMQ